MVGADAEAAIVVGALYGYSNVAGLLSIYVLSDCPVVCPSTR